MRKMRQGRSGFGGVESENILRRLSSAGMSRPRYTDRAPCAGSKGAGASRTIGPPVQVVKEILSPGLKDSECMLQSTHNKNEVLKLSEGASAVFASATNDLREKKVFWIHACIRIRRKSRCAQHMGVLKFLPLPTTERNQKTLPSQKPKGAETSQALFPNPQTNIHKKQSSKTNIGE